MHHRKRTLLLSLLIFAALFSCRVTQAFQLPAPLVDGDWLQQHSDEVVILDVRDDIESFTRKAVLVRKRFTGDLRLRVLGAHIPGAVLVDFLNIRTSREIDGRRVRYMIPEKTEFEQLMQSWGVNNGDAIVIVSPATSNSDVTMATRLYWQIKYFGHDNVALLDGGMALWLLEQRPATIETQEPRTGTWTAGKERDGMIASSDDVVMAIENNDAQLVDTRSLGFYLGALKQSYVRSKGHIPGAKVFPSELLTGARAPVMFAGAEDIKHMASELGIDATAELITYCNSGQWASASWFVFSELLGNSQARLYDGSMHQWALERRKLTSMKME